MKIVGWKKLFFMSVVLGIMAIPSMTIAQTNLESEIPIQTENNATTNAATIPKITTVSSNISNGVINVGETFSVTIKGTARMSASILLVGDKQRVQEYNAKETTPGVYVAHITLTQSDRFIEGAMIARLQKGTRVIYSAAQQALTVNAGDNQNSSLNSYNNQIATTTSFDPQNISLPLTITSHQNGESITSNGVTIQGQTEPNAEIKIKITSSSALVGNLIQIEGDTLIEQIVNADNEGKFTVTLPQNSRATKGLQYQISAIAFKENSRSRLLQLTLIQK